MPQTTSLTLGNTAEPQIDGRRQRSETSRKKILRAMLDLISAGDVDPNAEAVAAQAGLGLRTVFRHFENMETLYREINIAMTADLVPMAMQPFRATQWRGMLEEMLDRRVRLFERMMPFKIAADVHRHKSPYLARQGVELVRAQRAVLERIIPEEERSDSDFIEALDLVLSFDTWRRLRKDQELTVAQARSTVNALVNALLKGH